VTIEQDFRADIRLECERHRGEMVFYLGMALHEAQCLGDADVEREIGNLMALDRYRRSAVTL
jgi:hypothetical protein